MRILAIILTALAGAFLVASAKAETLGVVGDRLFVPARVNGVPVSALLDSAAEISFADKAFAEANGFTASGGETAKGTGGTAEVSFIENTEVEALGVKMEGLTIAALDLSDISNRLLGRRADFILGREIFDRARLAIDIEGGAIATIDADVTPKGAELALTETRGVETFKSTVNGVEADAEFDLGNGSGVLIGKALAERLGLLDHAEALATRKGGGVGGEVERKIVTLKRLSFAGVTFRNIEAAVDETENAGEINIGVGLLRKFRIVTDFSEKKLWLEKR